MIRLNPTFVTQRLIKLNLLIFSVKEFSKIFNVKKATAGVFLSRSSKTENSSFLRVKRGVYILSISPPTKFELANKLYQPSYISFETALSFYNVIPEAIYTITSATIKRGKEFDALNSIFKYHKIKKTLFFGYRTKKIKGGTIMIAEKEKALLDYLYLLSLKKRPINKRIDLRKININRLIYYIKFFKKNIKKSKAFLNLVEEAL